MSHSKTDGTRRWTTLVPAAEIEPKGDVECLRRALRQLGPMPKKQEDADRLGPWTAYGGSRAVSEEWAIQLIYSLASAYNKQTYLSRGAPRVKDVIQELAELERRAGELSRYLQSLDDYSRLLLQTAGSGVANFHEYTDYPLMKEANFDGLPKPADHAPILDGWVSNLAALSRYVNATLNNFLISNGIETIDSADKGGNTDLYKHIYGNARWSFVKEGWHIYEMCKPGQATGTVDGPFHEFLEAVFEFATGLKPEKHAKLEQFLKSVVSSNRRMKNLLKQEAELYRKSLKIGKQKMPREEKLRELKEIEEEEERLGAEIYEVWAELYPYTYGRQKPGKSTPASTA
jgi:hypothetical protein